MQCPQCGHQPAYRHGKAQLSRPRYFCPACHKISTKPWLTVRRSLLVLGMAGLAALSVYGYLLLTGQVTVGGVPASVILTFLRDDFARQAYFQGRNVMLHDRLVQLDIEAQMKDFYRDRIADDQALDLYIHQILYNRTGYVGDAYQTGQDGNLVLKPSGSVP
ncbi:MAG: hypothetical protein HC873_15015 [Leptolyngbyaceae cyanobacterium SL_1_1]|nr:hypothetical protein [Leptolyngbyaceae cyanobacterium SL_1_1]